ncbi:MFS transporter [Sporosarcina gallistercoris]|uniref:MFS transporter n=1 Tax=Sporosarcina gallistercoris TaxID=2762245 RepID=A0ABR8PKA1_9BACL|nr:MFS transporter [Sporosarcina gallistercoris]MBD7908586.1 MFS transporter [Sporosarcina gallistercoris]
MKLKRATYHLWTFTASKMISAFGAQIYAFAISFYILQLTGSATSFAANLICSILPRTLMAPFAGYVADTYSRKRIVILAQIVSTIAIIGLLIISLTNGLSLPAIYATTVVLSLASTFSGIAFTSSITGLVDEERIQKAMSLNQMSVSFAAIGSPAVGGLLYGAVSMPVFLILYASASILAVVLESTMDFNLFAKRQVKEEGTPKEKMFDSMKAGLAYARLQPLLMAVIWVALLVNFLFGAVQVGYSFILIEKLKILPAHFGLIEGGMAVGILLMSIYLAARKSFSSPLSVSKWGIASMGLSMGLIAVPLLFSLPYGGIFTFYLTLSFVSGALGPLVNTPIQVFMMKRIDDDYKGRVFSILETMAMALMPLGMVLFGFLYDVLPAPWILISSSALLILTVFILLRASVIRQVTGANPEERLDTAST